MNSHEFIIGKRHGGSVSINVDLHTPIPEGAKLVEIISRRSWRERLTKLPWRPWHNEVCMRMNGPMVDVGDGSWHIEIDGPVEFFTRRASR